MSHAYTRKIKNEEQESRQVSLIYFQLHVNAE